MKSSRWVPWMLGALVAALCAVTLRVAAASAPQGQSAFAAGYQAYQRGDLAAAIPNLQAAAVDSGVLEDYALFFLGQAQFDSHDLDGATANFTRLTIHYPESLYAARASLALANIATARNQFEPARSNASMALDTARSAFVEASARLVLARALIALGQAPQAYEQLQEVRRNHPRSAADASARAAEKALLQAHPEVADVNSLSYLTQEAPLLLTEGQMDEAYSTPKGRLRWKLPPRRGPRCCGCRPRRRVAAPSARSVRSSRIWRRRLRGPRRPTRCTIWRAFTGIARTPPARAVTSGKL